MTTISTLSDNSLDALKRDHERLRYEVQALRTILRSFISTSGDRGYKTTCRFTLNSALTTSDASKAATATEFRGYGRDHASTSITVYNHLTHAAGVYMYAGDSGDAGQAYYNPSDKKWWIFDMECP